MNPPRTKPRVFIGSSVEGLPVAEAMQLALDHDAEVTIWSQGVFGLSRGTLEELVHGLDRFEYAILVLSRDDLVHKRDTIGNCPRDNVIFELGLFMGALGRDRTFIVYCRDAKPELPSDLAGVTAATYGNRTDQNLHAALGAACTQIKTAISAIKRAQQPSDAASLDSRNAKEQPAPDAQPAPSQIGSHGSLGAPSAVVTPVKQSSYDWAPESVNWFEFRMAQAFPGVRGMKIYDSPPDIVRRLVRFFQAPPEAHARGVKAPDVWWFQGGPSDTIETVLPLSGEKLLIDEYEICPTKLAVYRPGSPWYQIIYLEIAPELPVLVRDTDTDESDFEPRTSESYALLNGRVITVAEHFDGVAELDGEFLDASGSEYRTRFLTRTNWLLVPQGTPLNAPERDPEIKTWLRRLLAEPSKLESFFEDYFHKLPKRVF